MTVAETNYLDPQTPAGLRHITMPVQLGNYENLVGFGQPVVADHESFEIEIVRWPATGWRPIDTDSGDEAGTTQGVFSSYWKGDVLYGRNEAVGGHYVLGYATDPATAREDHSRSADSILMWHANYHPDGGQLFFPLDNKPFVVPLALPGDDIQPSDFVCFWFDGSCGLYIHPGVWHEGVFTCQGTQRFFDRQGAVHARVSANFPNEFECLLQAPLTRPLAT